MKKHARTLVIILAALAFVASASSLYVHYRLLADPSYTSFCDVSETVSCEAVMTSRFGYVAGVPVAAGGAIWSALVLILAAVGMRSASVPGSPGGPGPASAKGYGGSAIAPAKAEKARPAAIDDRAARVAGYVFILSTIGLAAVLYLGYASFFVLRQMCPLCLTMYVAVIGLFIVSGGAAGDLSALPGRLGEDLRAAFGSALPASLTVGWAIVAVALVLLFPREELATATIVSDSAAAAPTETLGSEEVTQFESWLAVQPRAELGVPANGARVVVVKFNDYQCPACRQAYIAYKAIQQKYESQYPGQVAFVNVDYPLESECNTGGIHSAACEAAVAVRLARARNRDREMEAWLFDNQATLTRDTVKEGLAEIAQVTDFDAQYNTTLEAVRTDAQLGQKLQINGTPTFYINGIRIGSTLRPSYFDAAIAYELKRAQGATP
jgi:uncharacterized membrane protein/protein-disulfide isomerase